MAKGAPKLIPIEVEEDIVRARRAGRDTARELGFSAAYQTRVATAISELARNALTYAGSGVCQVHALQDPWIVSIRVTVVDEGPGIADLSAALDDGFATENGLGKGLAGTKRLVDEFQVTSRPGRTRVTVTIKSARR